MHRLKYLQKESPVTAIKLQSSCKKHAPGALQLQLEKLQHTNGMLVPATQIPLLKAVQAHGIVRRAPGMCCDKQPGISAQYRLDQVMVLTDIPPSP